MQNNKDDERMEAVKIYFLIALIGAIAAASRRKIEPDSRHNTQQSGGHPMPLGHTR